MASSGSTRVIVAALGGNAGIAVAKFVAAAWTGSAAMLSEAIHSLADTANQGLLLHGIRRAQRPADDRHPFGHSRELYFWAFVVAVLLFSLGAGVAIYEGIDKLNHPHPVTNPWLNYSILGTALLFEIGSTAVAMKEFNRQHGDLDAIAALRASKDPGLYTVLLENIAAIAGLIVALIGIAGGHLLGWTYGDAVASIVIGIILGLVATFMAIETKALLIGEAAAPDVVTGIRHIIEAEIMPMGRLRRIHHIKTMHLGPDDVMLTASLDFDDGTSARSVMDTVSRLEKVIFAQFPFVRHLYLEAAGDGARPTTELAAVAELGSNPLPEHSAAQSGPVGDNRSQARAGNIEAPKRAYPPAKKGKGKKHR